MLTTTEKLILAIKSLRPTSEFSIIGGDYSAITWDVLEGDAPTEKEIADEIKSIEKAEGEKELTQAAQRQSILDRLGLTADEAALLLK
jgi:hypothetical protein